MKEEAVAKGARRRISKALQYKQCFNSDVGKEVLKDLISFSGFISSNFKSDPYETAFCEGQRNVVLRILKFLEEDVEMIRKRVREVNDEFFEEV